MIIISNEKKHIENSRQTQVTSLSLNASKRCADSVVKKMTLLSFKLSGWYQLDKLGQMLVGMGGYQSDLD